jgi:hypothetical protein
MSKSQKKKLESTTSEVLEEEQYLTYTNHGTINVTVSGNNNTVTFMAGQPTNPPPKPPGGGQ